MNLKRLLMIIGCLCACVVTFAVTNGKFVLVIDAGHGGRDAGACSGNAMEKTINLKVALAFGRYVERNCSDVKVVYTRKTDVFIPLHERADIANRNKADAFISIHTNSVASKKPISGMETYTMGMRRSDEKLSAAQRENEVILIEKDYQQHYSGYDPRSPESMLIFEVINEQNMVESVELARLIQQYTCATANRPNKGVKQDAFLVLRETSMPACLIELGYITTPSERAYLTNDISVDLMGRGIYQAFVAYKNRHMGKKAATQPVQQPVKPTVQEPTKPTVDEPVREPEQQPVQEPVKQPAVQQPVAESAAQPVFKVQLLAVDRKLPAKSAQLKGVKNVDCYKEGALWKYTVGASTDYNEIYQLRKSLLKSFPQAFIIAFRQGEKMDVNVAIREFKKNKKK